MKLLNYRTGVYLPNIDLFAKLASAKFARVAAARAPVYGGE